MKCGFCATEFDERQAAQACKSCPMHGCGLVRCPKCGYESPREPRWLRWLLGKEKKKDVAQ